MTKYSLPDADLRPPRVHTIGLTITTGSLLAIVAVLATINTATAPDIPAELLRSAREFDESQAASEPSASPTISPSPSPTTKPQIKR